MCISIYIGNETEIETLGQLRALVGNDSIKFWDAENASEPGDEEDNYCLCNVDIDATMRRAGYDVKWPHHRMSCEVKRQSDFADSKARGGASE
jgi:hypothetical protein